MKVSFTIGAELAITRPIFLWLEPDVPDYAKLVFPGTKGIVTQVWESDNLYCSITELVTGPKLLTALLTDEDGHIATDDKNQLQYFVMIQFSDGIWYAVKPEMFMSEKEMEETRNHFRH